MPRLLTIKAAAEELGIPPGSLRTAAEAHGLLVRMGRALRIDPETLPELIELCRGNPQEPACTFTPSASSFISATEPSSSQRALGPVDSYRSQMMAPTRNSMAM